MEPALYETIREAHISNIEFGKRLGISEEAVRRLLDLEHRSHIGQVEAGLQALGRRLKVEVQDAGELRKPSVRNRTMPRP